MAVELAERGNMKEKLKKLFASIKIFLNLLRNLSNREKKPKQKEASPIIIVNNGTINIEIHIDKD